MMLNVIDWNGLDQGERNSTIARPSAIGDQCLANAVAQIISDVREGGDRAVADCTRRFDSVEVASLRVAPEDLERAWTELGAREREALKFARDNIEAFHAAQLRDTIEVTTRPGVTCRRIVRPIDAVGLYVPAGTAPLPSTVLMLAVPAKVAGCTRRVIATPPGTDGRADTAVLAAAYLTGVDEVYVVGGAQAVAALAYGTESIAAVDKLFGPGNDWVTEAKLQVAKDPEGVACDMPAGPSEVLVIADDTANAAFVAADLLSQAEHGITSQSILLTTSSQLAARVSQEVSRQLDMLPRSRIAARALDHSTVILVRDLEQAVSISNGYAPEHLIIATNNADDLLDRIKAAGSVFLGHWTPESVGDYCSGTNHVLPTSGFARACSGLGIEDFQRRISVQELSAQGLQEIGDATMLLARLEGLEGHASAVEKRLQAITRWSAA